VPTSDYLDAVHRLDRTSMAAMEQRIEELERRGGLPGAEIDLAGLRHEHEDRSHRLARNLGRAPTGRYPPAQFCRPVISSCSTSTNNSMSAGPVRQLTIAGRSATRPA
jgi:hypothetical protein